MNSKSRKGDTSFLGKSILIALGAIGVVVLLIYFELDKPILGMDLMLITPIKVGLGLFFSTALFSALSHKLFRTRGTFSPYKTALNAVTFGVAAWVLIGFLVDLLLPTDFVYSRGRYVVTSLSIVAFILGIYFSQRQASEEPTVRRFVLSLAVSLVALSLLFYSTGIVLHPLQSSNPHRRMAWAKSHFGGHFSQAIEFVESSKQIRADVGEALEIFPSLTGRNYARGGAGDWSAYFTLDVAGPKGKGNASVEVVSGGSDSGVRTAEWTFGGSTKKLK
jgi:hypothetical protein